MEPGGIGGRCWNQGRRERNHVADGVGRDRSQSSRGSVCGRGIPVERGIGKMGKDVGREVGVAEGGNDPFGIDAVIMLWLEIKSDEKMGR